MLTWRAKPTETHPGWEMEKRLLQSPEVKVRCVLFYSNSQEHGLTVKRSNTFLGTSDTGITQNFSLNHFRAGLVTQWSPALRIEMIIMEKKSIDNPLKLQNISLWISDVSRLSGKQTINRCWDPCWIFSLLSFFFSFCSRRLTIQLPRLKLHSQAEQHILMS